MAKKKQRIISDVEIELVVKEVVEDVLGRLKAELLGHAVTNFTAEEDEKALWYRGLAKNFNNPHRIRECTVGGTKLAVQSIKDYRAIGSGK